MEQLREAKFEREPENIPGAFYVAKGQCIICMLPPEIAPTLMGFYQPSENDHARSHCYFKQQPVTAKEMELAIECVGSACCGALRYCGSEKTVIEKIRNGHNPDSVD